ncbi:MAG: hypothetical protein KDA78_20045 [Planctomycetaceae bacterium]|nr:hypothetical protein [Planctomycetaceae bacterium]
MESVSFKLASHFKLPTGLLSGALSEDGSQLLAACMDGVYQAELESKKYDKVAEHGSYVSSAAWLPVHGSYISAGYDGVLKWINAESKQVQREQKLHDFWSWDMAVSPDQSLIASVTGQYLAGGYKYEPQPEREPSVLILSAETGDILHRFEHVPSVQAVAFSPDNQLVAAGNLMGEIRIWNCQTGELVANWTTLDFTSWGIIKSHCYLGGIFALCFSPDGNEVLLAGMGPMHDPMAGNGRQLWQRWDWKQNPPVKRDETHQNESGEGLMETIAFHPSGQFFVMGGRLRGGDWNVAAFAAENGNRLATLKTGYRVTEALFSADGKKMILVGMQGQPGPDKEGNVGNFGRVESYEIQGFAG